jgi:LytS/YehU family sensor histidine kinase
VAAATAYRMFLDKVRSEQRNKEKEAENLKSELSFLRSQISPHFLFNVINNIVALARKKSDLVEPSLIDLSSLLRYFLYESNAEKVSLEKEIGYLQSFIDLQQLRFGKDVQVRFNAAGIESGYEIEPMLLIPFVENAFKHMEQNGPVDIQLRVNGNVLLFSISNPYNEKNVATKDDTSGIGLANVRRRLNLLYEKSHTLQISSDKGWFTVSLELKLH